ncbi:MAG: hypothetical protein AAF485_32750, partial [Chloroflexota bacterium]
PFSGSFKESRFNTLLLKLIALLASGVGISLTGFLFFGQPRVHLSILSITILLIFVGRWLVVTRVPFRLSFSITDKGLSLFGILIALVAGLLFGATFGLGFGQLLGMTLGTFDVTNSTRVVGLAAGFGVGIYFGRGGGVLGILVLQVILLPLLSLFGFNLILVAWLVGILIGGLVSSFADLWFLDGTVEFEEAYAYRYGYFWWLRRPPATVSIAELQTYHDEKVWDNLLRTVEKSRQETVPTVEETWHYLSASEWERRFIGHHLLVYLGNDALPDLINLAKGRLHPKRPLARWLLRSISHDTTERLGQHPEWTICQACLTHSRAYPLPESGYFTSYYGCRTCKQTHDFFYTPEGVTAVVDAYEYQEPNLTDGLLRLYWNSQLFDFDRVEIGSADDEFVERFVVQLGNDTDPTRSNRYDTIPCLIKQEAQLSENTLRILEQTFGSVDREG